MYLLIRFVIVIGILFGLALLSQSMLAISPPQSSSLQSESVGSWSQPQGFSAVLLSRPDVQAELKLDESQMEQLQQQFAELESDLLSAKEARPTIHGDESVFSVVTDEAKIVFDSQLEELLSPSQHERLRQLQTQTEGFHALQRPDVEAALVLSNGQKRKISNLPTTPFARKASPALREKGQQLLRAILTPNQIEAWNAMKGNDFSFKQLAEDESVLMPGWWKRKLQWSPTNEESEWSGE